MESLILLNLCALPIIPISYRLLRRRHPVKASIKMTVDVVIMTFFSINYIAFVLLNADKLGSIYAN